MCSRRDALFSLAAVGFFAVLPGFAAAQARREVRVGVVGVPTALDPAAGLEGTIPLVARHVYDTLVTYREGSTDVDAGLATRWAVSRDGLTWTFTLRDNARFHDGTPLTAVEVAASFARHLKPEGEPRAASGSSVVGASARDPRCCQGCARR